MRNVTCLVGGQYGSEAKGKFAAYLAKEFDVAVRVGGTNAGHCVVLGDKEYKFRQIPVASIMNDKATICIGAGGLIDMDILNEELGWIPDKLAGRLIIDRNAGMIEHEDKDTEKRTKAFERIGSTSKGIGAALARKIERKDFRTAIKVKELQGYIGNVSEFLSTVNNHQIMIEGTQGYALSLDHGPYPFCTSRNVLASSLLSDVGLSPFSVRDVIMVIRTFPIRVFGNSGPMFAETDWEAVTRISGSPVALLEKTTVTNRVRRVGHFDWNLLVEATRANGPTQIALAFIDYFDNRVNAKLRDFDKLSPYARKFIDDVEARTNTPVTMIGTGPDVYDIIDRRDKYALKGVS